MDQHDRRTDDDIPTRIPERIDLIDSRYDVPRDERYGPYPDMVPPHRLKRRSRKFLALGLFIATCLSTYFMGVLTFGLSGGLFYSASIIAILLSHEMGHYLQARRYRVPASLPYFIPMPLNPFGTMGAVIVQQGLPDRKQWYDIAITGPLAGLVLALPLMYLGVRDSEIIRIPAVAQGPIYGNPPILEWMVAHLHKPLGPGQDILLTPVLFAGWVGVFITALNLIPIGQLDGGHILYCLIGRRAHTVALALLWGAVGYMIYNDNYSYVAIVILLLLFGPKHPPTANDRVPLGWPRIVLGWLTLAFIFVGFTPTPIMMLEPEAPRPQQRQREPLGPVAVATAPPLGGATAAPALSISLSRNHSGRQWSPTSHGGATDEQFQPY